MPNYEEVSRKEEILNEWNTYEYPTQFVLERTLLFIKEKEHRGEYDKAYITALLSLGNY